jgi:hypothetical protein
MIDNKMDTLICDNVKGKCTLMGVDISRHGYDIKIKLKVL